MGRQIKGHPLCGTVTACKLEQTTAIKKKHNVETERQALRYLEKIVRSEGGGVRYHQYIGNGETKMSRAFMQNHIQDAIKKRELLKGF